MGLFLEIIAAIIAIIIVIQIVRLCFADGDLSLMFYTKFGKTIDEFSDKVIWITGASTGIGKSLALVLSQVPCKLILTSRREKELREVKQLCLANGKMKEEDVLVLPLDLLDTTIQFKTHVDNVIQHFGKIDILINNAGRSQRAKFEDIDIAVDKELFQLNVFSVVDLTTAVLPHFIQRKQGQVAVVSSLAGKAGVPCSRSYTGSKHALHGYFECMRIEMAKHNIDVTMVCPGPVFSDLLKIAFTDKKGEEVGKDFLSSDKRMTSERCAYLTAVAIANKLDEAWVCMQPVLLTFYAMQYFPTIARWVLKTVGDKKMLEYREGRKN